MDSKRFKKHPHNHISAPSKKGSGYLLYLLKCISPAAMAHHHRIHPNRNPFWPRWSIRRESCDAHTGWNWDPKWVRKRPHGVSLKHWDLLEVLPRCQKRLRNILKNGEKSSILWECTSSNIYAWNIVQNFKASEDTWSEKQKLLWMQIKGATNIRILGVAITFKRIGRTRETALWLRATASNPDVVLNE